MERICSKYFWNTQKASDIIGVDEHRAEYLMLKIKKFNISFIITCVVSYIMIQSKYNETYVWVCKGD